MEITLSWDQSVLNMASSVRAQFEAAVSAAANVLTSLITTPVTVTISVGWGEISQNGVSTAIPAGGAEGGPNVGHVYSYNQVESALKSHVHSATAQAYANLPAVDPSAGRGYFVAVAEASALGLPTYGSPASGAVGFGVSAYYNYSTTNCAVAGQADFVGIAIHELSHALGRLSNIGTGGPAAIADLFRFVSAGTLAVSPYQSSYFSTDGGVTALKYFDNTNSNSADWLSSRGSAVPDSFNASYRYGVLDPLSAADITLLDVLGFDVSLTQYLSQIAPTVHPNDLSYTSTASGSNHFIDILNFEASYSDLIQAFGTNQQAAQNWYDRDEPIEQRPESFDGLDYVASYNDLIGAFAPAGSLKAVQDAGASHYISDGSSEGRTTTFNGLDYIASYGDLIKAFGADNDAGAYHYIEGGHSEGRTTTFDGLDYIASYPDLIRAFGANEQAGAAHYIDHGYGEGRSTTFDGLDYIASYTDLMSAFGADSDAGAAHYIDDGYYEGRNKRFNVAAYEQAHPDLNGKFGSEDAFLAAYINNYTHTGTFLT